MYSLQNPASYGSAAQHSAVRFLAVPCGAALCRAALCSFELFRNTSIRYHAKYQAPGTGMCACTVLIFLFSSLDRHLSVLLVFVFCSKLHPYCRLARTRASNRQKAHSTAYCTDKGNQLCKKVAPGIIKSLVAQNHGLLLSAPFTKNSCVFFRARA